MTITYNTAGQMVFDQFAKIAERLLNEARDTITAYITEENAIQGNYVIKSQWHDDDGKFFMEVDDYEGMKNATYSYDYRTKKVDSQYREIAEKYVI